MALINIEYGALASSETMNKNFMYLDDKIAETADSIMTSISSILSNIATINTRLNDIAEEMSNSVDNINTNLEDYKTKTKILINKASMVPNWSSCEAIAISANTEYEVETNGYVLLKTTNNSQGNLIVNGIAIPMKTRVNSYDHNSLLVAYPVYKGDVLTSNVTFDAVYFLPVKEISIENF